ncbi:3-hydroxy-9,10-secoandrosta-1,3,5(10)-triene-9,17-dione monooxygenase oxygenase subunit [Actinomadura verrucosospora]|uniref:Flavin-dependent monooxygenase, oxygenase subunit HsaA n=1 Tax=Actinomadura verrucosospora TaxID=46165 RepID=A0A7D3VVP0_ACTVE|nr:3-hydroxy-9,10-secoandrosta-1,3,5(10)-triene-9,17-dione monooxygenase oxygenase subunit [Actinomadura verrucosospora]QKG19712.1 acyl-CoA dehydrogenase type 2 [Actinomadura verrucosospora]
MSEQVLEAVRDLVPAIAERAGEAEEARRVPESTIKELAGTGFFRLLQPKAFGGHEAHPATFYTAVREIAAACGSTGWVASVVGVHPWQLGLFPVRAQQEVWGDDPNSRISSSYAPTGKITPVDGGFRVSGRWSFSSGCDHADWVFLGGLVPGPDGNPVDMRTFLLPRADYRIDDVWHTIGLRGTGSNDIVVEDVFVPEHRTLSFADTSACACPGHEVNKAPLYRLPFAAVFSTTISMPIAGIAQGALDAYLKATRERIRVSYGGQKVAEDPHAQVRIATAAGEIDAAWTLMERNITELMAAAEAGEEFSLKLRLRTRRDQVMATARSIRAVDLLFENAGGHALKEGHPVQRGWRDAHAGRVHAVNDPERALTLYGMGALGLEVTDTMI